MTEFRLVPIQLILAGRKSVFMVFMWFESVKPKLWRFMQRKRNKMQTSDIQRIRKRIFQVVQLQELSKCSILQRYSQGHDQSVSQVTQRILWNLGWTGILDSFSWSFEFNIYLWFIHSFNAFICFMFHLFVIQQFILCHILVGSI